MKKIIIITLLFTVFSLIKVSAYDYGIVKPNDNEQPYPGRVFDELISKHNAFYIGKKECNNVYLTFDTGYELGNTAGILDVLKETKTKATFFITGHFINTHPELVKRMADEGHIVGNHTFHHPDITMKSKEEIAKELKMLEDKYFEVTKKEMDKFFRPPCGKFDEASLKVIDELGYTSVFWSLAYVDWKLDNHGKDYAYQNIINYIHSGAIVLLHTVSADNKDALYDIITTLKKTYNLERVDNLIIE